MSGLKNKSLFKNITLSMSVEGRNDDFLAFFRKQVNAHEAVNKSLDERVDDLIANNIDLQFFSKETTEFIKNIFKMGYVFGWDDYKEVTEE